MAESPRDKNYFLTDKVMQSIENKRIEPSYAYVYGLAHDSSDYVKLNLDDQREVDAFIEKVDKTILGNRKFENAFLQYRYRRRQEFITYRDHQTFLKLRSAPLFPLNGLVTQGFVWSEKEESHFIHNFFDLERKPFYYTLSAGNRTRDGLAAEGATS